MPIRPNLLERQLIQRGVVPWPMLDALLAVTQVAAVVSAAELGVFEALRDGALGVDALAQRTGASVEGMVPLIDALAGLGYVRRENGAVALTPEARRAVPLEEMRGLAPFLWTQLTLSGQATRAVREAPPGGLGDRSVIQGGETGRSFQRAMRLIASGNLDAVARAVELPAGARRLLDVGGSHGLYSVALCRKYPQLHATVLDWPVGLEAAQETLRDHPELATRIDTLAADFERDEIPAGYDVAFLGNIVHGLDAAGNLALFRKLAAATGPNGAVVVLDQLADAGGSPFARALAGLIGFNLFLATGGRAYRFDQMARWLTEAGFPHVRKVPLRRAPGMAVVVARKTAG